MSEPESRPTPGAQPPSSQVPQFAPVWKKFLSKFPREEDCIEELARRIEKRGLRCKNCGCIVLRRTYGARVVRCNRCGASVWITAGTFFHRIRSARPWLAAIWLMEHGITINAAKFHELVHTSHASALTIFKKLTTVVAGQLGADAAPVPSASFVAIFAKRSRITPPKRRPRDEVEIARIHGFATGSGEGSDKPGVETASAFSVDGAVPGTSPNKEHAEPQSGILSDHVSGPEKSVFALLSGEPQSFDVLFQRSGLPAGDLSAALTMLELSGLARLLPGGKYGRADAAASGPAQPGSSTLPASCSADERQLCPESAKLVDQTVKFLRWHFRYGISRKYLQNYLAACWCYADRWHWRRGTLLEACLTFGMIKYEKILAYVSPGTVRMWFAPA